jgi:hypothetical protein
MFVTHCVNQTMLLRAPFILLPLQSFLICLVFKLSLMYLYITVLPCILAIVWKRLGLLNLFSLYSMWGTADIIFVNIYLPQLPTSAQFDAGFNDENRAISPGVWRHWTAGVTSGCRMSVWGGWELGACQKLRVYMGKEGQYPLLVSPLVTSTSTGTDLDSLSKRSTSKFAQSDTAGRNWSGTCVQLRWPLW